MKYSHQNKAEQDRAAAMWRPMLVVLFAVSVLMTASVAADNSAPLPRAAYLGFAPAYPPPDLLLERKDPLLPITQDSLVWLTLLVDAKGHPTGFTADTLYDSAVTKHLMQFFEPARLTPAAREGRAIASALRLHIRIRPNGLAPMVFWPVGSDGLVMDQTLFEQTVRSNDVLPPSLRTFPSYHGDIKRKDSLTVYPFVLIRVDLDSAGVPTAITPLRSTYGGFDQLLYTACNWATYTPALVQGRAVPSTVYVFVAFLANVSYPTRPLDFAMPLPLRDALRVRTLYDTLGPLAPAIPRFIADDSLLMEGNPGITNGEGAVLCLVDTLGRARAARVAVTTNLQPRLQRLVSQLEYYPALDHSGRPFGFVGPLRVRFTGSAYVRINVLWLAPDNPQLR